MSSDKKETGQGSRQHYVPRFWLNNFSPQKNNVVRTIDRQHPGRVQRHSGEDIGKCVPFVRRESAKDVFQKRCLFSDEIEADLGKIEDAGAPAIRRLIEAAESGDLSIVDNNDRRAISVLLPSLQLRSFPYNLSSTKLHGREADHDRIKRWWESGSTDEEGDIAQMTEAEFYEMLQVVMGLPSLIDGLVVARIRDSDTAFVTGGVPFATICEGEHRGTFFPISPKLAIYTAHVTSDRFLDAPAKLVPTVNGFIYGLGGKVVVQGDKHAEVVADSEADITLWGETTIAARMPGFAALAWEIDDIVGKAPDRLGPFVRMSKRGVESPARDRTTTPMSNHQQIRNHYVSQSLLERFADKDEHGRDSVSVFSKERADQGLFERPVEEMFRGRGIFGGEAEELCRCIERRGAAIVDKLDTHTKQKKPLELTESERSDLNRFVVSLIARSVPFLREHARGTPLWSYVENFLFGMLGSSDAEAEREMTPEVMNDAIQKILRRRCPLGKIHVKYCERTDLHLATGNIPFAEINELDRDRNWENGRLMRLTSGGILVPEDPEKSGLVGLLVATPSSECRIVRLWVPVNPKIAIRLSEREEDVIESDSGERAREINWKIYNSSPEIIVQSKSHLLEIQASSSLDTG